MNTEAIGSWAGLVWNALSATDTVGLKQLKKITKLKDKEVFAAIGWLARENRHPPQRRRRKGHPLPACAGLKSTGITRYN
jgi:hypothetical protein